MSDAAISLLQAVERSASTPIDGNLCREVIAENIRLREALEPFAEMKMAQPEDNDKVLALFGIRGQRHILNGDIRRARAALNIQQRASE